MVSFDVLYHLYRTMKKKKKKKKKKKREESFSMRLPLFTLPAGGDNIIRYVKLIEHTLKLELLPTEIEPMTFVL